MKIRRILSQTCAHRVPTGSLKKRIGSLLTVAALALTGSAQAQLAATLTDFGATAPTPGTDDAYQLTTGSGNPDGLNYYFDNGNPPGQTFTTGANPNGYLLNSLNIATAGNSGGLPGAGQAYTLRLYTVSGSTATPLVTYQSQAGFTFADFDWLEWSGLNLGLQPNTQYAYTLRRNGAGWENLANVSGNLYAGGEVCLIPTAGGAITYGSSHGFDAAFDVGLSVASTLTVNPVTITPDIAVAVGTTATLSTAPAVGPGGPFGYQWKTDGGTGGTLTNIPAATGTSLAVNTTGMALGLYRYVVVVTNNSTSVTSAEATLNVFTRSGAALTDKGTVISPGYYDISQLAGGGNGDGLNYYNDNNPPCGQTFTTGNNTQGYWLTNVTIATGGGGSSGTTTLQGYNLWIYAVNGSTAVLLANYTNSSFGFTYGNWVTWDGFSLFLQPNTTYAYAFRRNTTGWAGLTSTPNTTDLYAGGQLCQIPQGGGPITFGNTGLSDAAFDLGMWAVGGSVPTPFPSAIAFSPGRTVVAGTTVTMTEVSAGSAPLHYQWRTDGGTGGALTNIPGSTATNLVANTTGWVPKAYRYDVVVTNSYGSATSAVATLTLVYADTAALLSDIGQQDPLPVVEHDSAQMVNGGGNPDGLNYYMDNGNPPGQTYTTGSDPSGYTLTSMAVRIGTGSMGGLPAGGQAYVLRVYAVSGGSATLYATYTSQTNVTFVASDWLRWSGFALPLAANTTYAYTFSRASGATGWANMGHTSGNPYAGGEVVLIPAGGGTIIPGGSHDFDAAFVAGLAVAGKPGVSPALLSAYTVYAGSPVTANATVTGTGPFTYQWQTDGGNTGTITNIPLANSLTLPVDTTGLDNLTVAYRLVVGNGSGYTTGEVALLTVNAGSTPIIVTDTTPSPAVGYLGGSITFSATVAGTLPISYQWQVDKGSGATNLVGQTGTTLTLTNLALTSAGNYSLYVTNLIGPNSSSPAALTIQTNPTPTSLTSQLAGNQLTLIWPADHLGWTLQAQTNSLSTGLGVNWVNVPGSGAVTSQTLTVDPAAGSVFYRLVYP